MYRLCATLHAIGDCWNEITLSAGDTIFFLPASLFSSFPSTSSSIRHRTMADPQLRKRRGHEPYNENTIPSPTLADDNKKVGSTRSPTCQKYAVLTDDQKGTAFSTRTTIWKVEQATCYGIGVCHCVEHYHYLLQDMAPCRSRVSEWLDI